VSSGWGGGRWGGEAAHYSAIAAPIHGQRMQNPGFIAMQKLSKA